MWVNILIVYYLLSVIYIAFMAIFRKKGRGTQAMILLSCPFISLFFIYAMAKRKNKDGELPDWLLRRETYEDTSLQSPDIEKEVNVIPFDDALKLNSPKVQRKMLIDFLKSEFLQHAEALEQALKSEDSETSHYAAAAIQQTKGDLLSSMRKLEAQIRESETDVDALESYSEALRKYIRVEFLDSKTREKYRYIFLHVLDRLIEQTAVPKPRYYEEKIKMALLLNEHQTAYYTSIQFLKIFPDIEESYFSALHVHYQMRNHEEFSHTITLLRTSNTTLSPKRLDQLRFWLQGDLYEQQV
ncbi:hypothetical protein JOC78_002041 [Bacillus ectoiniformans]|uniref:hypothetical protein n=1 Tax=Bacillus ectoiniformans TaxID=1494429 RepID=UPI00195ED98E|nr:hypothetical protein [Bacillus ectoiniformans]MBM7649088.1 hypothetical protein [Bacillus ectoiniformans]